MTNKRKANEEKLYAQFDEWNAKISLLKANAFFHSFDVHSDSGFWEKSAFITGP